MPKPNPPNNRSSEPPALADTKRLSNSAATARIHPQLEELPSEIILSITSNLDAFEDVKSLAQTCSRIHKILLPTLFSHVRLYLPADVNHRSKRVKVLTRQAVFARYAMFLS